MPKYGIHHIVLKEAASQLSALPDPGARSAGEVINAELPSAVIGSVGPDLFFWGPDYEIVQKIYRLHRTIEDVLSLYNSVVAPIRSVKDAVGEATEAVVGSLAPNTLELVKRLVEEVKQTASLFKSALGMNLLNGVLEGVNLVTNAAGLGSAAHGFFQTFVPDVHRNKPESEWYWFDMLHYRRSGFFAKGLVLGAVTPREKAFAYGYLSHIAADVAGHPYVNTIVGAPYRMNVQRHVTAENFQDSWKYKRYYNGESINRTLLARMGIPERLPADVGDLLGRTFTGVYGGLPADRRPRRLGGNGFYTRTQIDETYDVFYKVLALMAGMAVERPTEPFSGAADILADALDAFSPPPSPPDSPSSACSWTDILSFGLTERSRECYRNFFEELESWLDYLGELMAWTLQTLLNLIDLVLALLLSLPICVLLALLYGIQLLCYQAYRSARLALATCGFVMPEPDELDTSIGRNLITLADVCAENFKNFPSRPSISAPGGPMRRSAVRSKPEACSRTGFPSEMPPTLRCGWSPTHTTPTGRRRWMRCSSPTGTWMRTAVMATVPGRELCRKPSPMRWPTRATRWSERVFGSTAEHSVPELFRRPAPQPAARQSRNRDQRCAVDEETASRSEGLRGIPGDRRLPRGRRSWPEPADQDPPGILSHHQPEKDLLHRSRTGQLGVVRDSGQLRSSFGEPRVHRAPTFSPAHFFWKYGPSHPSCTCSMRRGRHSDAHRR